MLVKKWKSVIMRKLNLILKNIAKAISSGKVARFYTIILLHSRYICYSTTLYHERSN